MADQLTQIRDDQANVKAQRLASIQPASWNETDRSFEVVWTTGAAVTRFDWYDGGYYVETLSTEPAAVRLERLQQGGPVLVDHIARVGALAGSIVPGTARMENGQGLARVRLADSDDMKDVVAKVRDGHLRTVSVGYNVHVYEITKGTNGERDRMHATDWEPVEISLTPVPADAGAIVRAEGKTNMTRIVERARDMPTRDDDRRPLYSRMGEPSRVKLATAEQISRACARAKFDRAFEQQLLDEHEAEPLTEAQLYRSVSDRLIDQRSMPSIDVRSGLGDRSRSQRDLFADALYSRLSGKPASDEAREYVGASLVDMARAMLEAKGEHLRWARPAGVLDALQRTGSHVASDFTFLIDSASRRFLLDAYRAQQSPLKKLANKIDLRDFRKRFAVQVEGPSVLRLVPENAEFKRVTMVEAQNSWKLNTYGEIFQISRQALINDDLGVFSEIGRFWGRTLDQTEASFLTALISGNGPIMDEDGKTLYHADHGNLAGSAAAITVTSLSAARQQMRGIKNRDGSTLADVVPAFLVVGPAKETEAEQILASLNAASVSDVNPFSGKLELIVDARLTGNSWRLFAAPEVSPVLEYGNLEGQEGLYTEAKMGFDVDGVAFKARTDLGAGVVDWRGTFMNPGA